MEQLVHQILADWKFGLCTIIATLVTIATPIVLFYLWCYRRLFTERSNEPVPNPISANEVAPVTLRPTHCESPEDFDYLRGRTVRVTGLIVHKDYDADPPNFLLYPFPFDIEAKVRCEFSEEKSRMVRRLKSLKLIRVVGKATEGIQIDKHHDDVGITLNECRIETPSFWIWLRHEWHGLWNLLVWGW